MASVTDNVKSKGKGFTIENNILIGAEHVVNGEQKLGPIILEALNKHPDHVSQIDAETGNQTTHAEMKDRGIRCALWLRKLGIDPNDIIVACTHNHLDSYVPLFATLFVDAIFTGWDYNMNIESACYYLKHCIPKVIFVCETAANVIQEASQREKMNVEIVVFGEHSTLPTLSKIMNGHTREEIEKFTITTLKSPKDVSIILWTSGSTGRRKGVMKTGASLLWSASSHSLLFSFVGAPQKFLWYTTIDWVGCIRFLLEMVVKEQTRIISTQCELENTLQIIEKYKVNQALLPPDLITCLAKSHLPRKYDLSSLTRIIVGGSKLCNGVLEALKRNIPTAFISTAYASSELSTITIKTDTCKSADSAGIPNTNVQIKFIDLTSGKRLGPNQLGEVFVKSPNVMIGYYKHPEETKEAFDEGWYRTRDIGYYDENGEIFIVGRVNDVIRYRTHKILPVPIEDILLSHPDVLEAVVLGLPHKVDGEWLTAFCKKSPESKVTEEELMKLISDLKDFKKLRGGIHFVDNMPHTACGKIARNEMKLLANKLIIH